MGIKLFFGELHLKCITMNLDDTTALLVFILNCIFYGLGTMIAGCVAGGDKVKPCMTAGLLQYFFGWLIFPWVWSCYMGQQIYKISTKIPGGDGVE